MKKQLLILALVLICSVTYGQTKRIYQLNTQSTYDSDYFVPVDKSSLTNTKKMSLATIASAINALQSVTTDSLKSAIGLSSGYITDENSNYIKQADFTAIGLSPNLYNADRILDSIAKVNADAISGQSGDLTSTTVTLSVPEILALNTVPKVLLDTPSTGYMWDIVSIMMSYTAGGTGYTTAGNTYLVVKYTSTAITDSISDVFLENNSNHQIKVSIPSDYSTNTNVDLNNDQVLLTTDSANPTLGNGTIKVYILYRKITL